MKLAIYCLRGIHELPLLIFKLLLGHLLFNIEHIKWVILIHAELQATFYSTFRRMRHFLKVILLNLKRKVLKSRLYLAVNPLFQVYP